MSTKIVHVLYIYNVHILMQLYFNNVFYLLFIYLFYASVWSNAKMSRSIGTLWSHLHCYDLHHEVNISGQRSSARKGQNYLMAPVPCPEFQILIASSDIRGSPFDFLFAV